MTSNFILWNVNPEIFNLFGLSIRYYGIFFVLAFLISPAIVKYIFEIEKRPIEDIEQGIAYTMIGTILGARLGHVLFYDLQYFMQHPIEIFLPISLHPHFHFTGFRGLASHGAGIGLIISTYLYSNYKINLRWSSFKFSIKKHRRPNQSFLWCGDILVIFVALGGACIRLGNFMNSEIYGKITNKPYGVVFAKHVENGIKTSIPFVNNIKIEKNKNTISNINYQPVNIKLAFNEINVNENEFKEFVNDRLKVILKNNGLIKQHLILSENKLDYLIKKTGSKNYEVKISALGIPRHPSVLYESISTFLLFVFLLLIWKFFWKNLKEGVLSAIFFIYIFGLRFLYEFLKLGYKPFTFSQLNTAQFLSIGFILFGLALLFIPKKRTHYIK